MKDWISIRNKWPEHEGYYRVKDCRWDHVEATVFYNGFDFDRPNYPIPVKGSLLMRDYTITHWKTLPEKLA